MLCSSMCDVQSLHLAKHKDADNWTIFKSLCPNVITQDVYRKNKRSIPT